MGMTSYVIGIRPPDDKYKKMLAVYNACITANIVIPDEITDFFNGQDPDPAEVHIDLKDTGKNPCVLNYYDVEGNSQGLEVVLDRLPKDIRILRFVNSF